MVDDMGWCRDPLPRLRKMDPAVMNPLDEAKKPRIGTECTRTADAAAVAGGASSLSTESSTNGSMRRSSSRSSQATCSMFPHFRSTSSHRRRLRREGLADPPAVRSTPPGSRRRSTPQPTASVIRTRRMWPPPGRPRRERFNDRGQLRRSRSARTCGLPELAPT